jgi:hypothetical protein
MRDWKLYTGGLSIFSLSDCHENLTLWESHLCVAIPFASDEDSSLSLEKPLAVNYSDTRPEISSLSEQISTIFDRQEVGIQGYFPDNFLYKAKLLSKEKQWRLLKSVDTNQQDESLRFEDIGFAPAQIRAECLDAGMKKTRKRKLVTSLQSHYPKAKQFQAPLYLISSSLVSKG